MSSRRVALVSALFVAFVLLAAAGPGAAGGRSAGCAPRCGGEYPSLRGGGHSGPVSCISDPGCGGGAALATGMTAIVIVLVGGAASIGRALATWRRRHEWSRQPLGVLLASALFRPPRLLLDV